MTATIIILPVVRVERFCAPSPVIEQQQPNTVRRRYTVELHRTPADWKRLEQMAWDKGCTVDRLIAAMVSEQLDGEGEV